VIPTKKTKAASNFANVTSANFNFYGDHQTNT